MRDLNAYENFYGTKSFEEIQVVYRRRKMLQVMRKYKHDHILEIGCGTDPLFAHMDDYLSMAVVEPGNGFYEHACELSKEDSRITCYKGFFEDEVKNLLENQPPFDFIAASMLAELEDIDRGYQALYNICSEKTILYLCVSNAESLHRLVAYEAGLIKDIAEISGRGEKLLQRRGPYTMDELCTQIEKNGFEIIEKGSYFPKLFTHQQMQNMLEQNIITKDVLDGMYNMEKYLPRYGSEIYAACVKK
ncbi:MAG: class I SAM-dependent methyltransferase [Lachnospiraceae bacterium]|jgi:hypothetical protein|nr:class I SAM-dependent methyltransferase [Lachnospiraceae bacterium]